MTPNSDSRGVATLISDLAQQTSTLIQTELKLLRAEFYEKVGQLGSGAAEVAAGAICLLAALLVLLQALVVALVKTGLGAGWASLLVGVVVAVFGVILIWRGKSNLSSANLAPERTQDQLRRDAQVVKEQVQ